MHGADQETEASKGDPPGIVRLTAELAVTRVVWVSGGKDSTAMALRLAELHPDVPWRYVCTPTRNELPAVHDHWERLGELLGRPLERV